MRWSANWIWHPEEIDAPNSYYYLRKEFRTIGPRALTIYVSADTRYRLHLDGEEIGMGPLRSQPWNMYYDRYQVAVEAGEHCLAAEAYYQGSAGPDSSPRFRGGFLLEARGEEGSLILTTDETWSIIPAKAWRRNTREFRMNKVNAYQEFFDARAIPVDADGRRWKEYGFDDSAWRAAAVVGSGVPLASPAARPPQTGPWSRLRERDIPFMAITARRPVAVTVAEECQGLANRQRSDDVSIRLSMPGLPPHWSTIEGAESLTAATSAAGALLRCSTEHTRDRMFDGFFEPCLTLDFGTQITAHLELEIEGPAGAVIEFGFAERLIDDRFNNSLEGFFGGAYTLRGPTIADDGAAGEAETFRTFNWIGFRYLRLRVSNAFTDLRLRAVRAIETTYPFEERGSFRSEDQRLESVFRLCKNTLRLCSNEFIMDTPWREQGQWLGDVAAVTLGGIYACFGDRLLAEKFLRQSGANALPNGLITNMTNSASFDWVSPIPDYSLWWVRSVWNHYEYFGDPALVHELYPQCLRVFQFFQACIDETGLAYRIPCWNFVDWAPVDRGGYSASMNGILYAATLAWEKMAVLRGDARFAEEVAEMKNGIAASFEQLFWDEGRGVLVDAADNPADRSNAVSEHTNALALWLGLVSGERAARVIANVFELPAVAPVEAQPYFCSFVLLALKQVGRMDLALKILRDRWGARMADRGATSAYEEWGINGSYRAGPYAGFMRTLSHAWSAFPAEFLTMHVAGMRILEPGCVRLSFDPADIGADYRIEIPLPTGTAVIEMRGGHATIS